MSIRDTYLSNEDIEPDQNQTNIVNRFERLQKEIIGERKISGKILSLFRDEQKRSNGIYLWGDVGRGKTFLMDLFFESLPIEEKDRKHFHRLMEEIHNGINKFKDHPDPINEVANSIASKKEVLCIDEFYVEDIADATIMARLIKSLLNQRIRLIITSNCKPDDLYKNGLQRDLFIPAIKQIKQSLEITHIGDGRDYRHFIEGKGVDRISIHGENKLGFKFVHGSADLNLRYDYKIGDGKKKPVFDEALLEKKQITSLEGEKGTYILFHDELLHGGEILKNNIPRVSIECTFQTLRTN